MAIFGNTGSYINVLGFSTHQRSYAIDFTTDANEYNVQDVNFYGRSYATLGIKLKPVIWNYTTGAVVTNGVAPEIVPNLTTNQWWTSTFSTEPVLAPSTRYWLGFVLFRPTSAGFLWGYATRASETYCTGPAMSYTTPTTFTIDGGPYNYKMMAYVNATAVVTGYPNDVYGVSSANISKVFGTATADVSKVYGVE